MKFGEYRCLLRMHTQTPKASDSWKTARHCHAECEMHVTLAGTCVIDVETETWELSAGEALLIAPGRYHSPVSASDDYVRFVIPFVMQDSVSAKDFIRRITPCMRICLTPFSVALCEKIREEAYSRRPFGREILQSAHTLLFAEVFRMISAAPVPEEKAEAADPDPRLYIIDDFFERNLTGNGTEDLLAKKLNLSRRQLARVLSVHYGMSYREKLRCARMDRAGWLLRTTDMPISRISEAVGYMSETSFFKAFKHHYRMTPLFYRQSMGQNDQTGREFSEI